MCESDNEGNTVEKKSDISISLDYDSAVNYAMQQNDVPVIKSIRIINGTDAALRDLNFRITTEPAFASSWETHVAAINPGETFGTGVIDLPLSHDFLASLTERVTGSLTVEILQEETVMAMSKHRIDVLAYDEWNGLQSVPEILAAFVTPNHPLVESLLSDAAGILGTWTGTSAISGYQSRDPNRVALTAAAVYAALQKRNIRYINPPASFEQTGQKIRLPDRILDSRLATCLDLTVIAASCLEQAGLHPLIVVTEGHAFVGVWLEEDTFADVATDDLLRLRKRVELGQITLFETTLLTHEPAISYEHAVKEGAKHLENESAFRCVIDIRRARKTRIRPLPLRVELASSSSESAPEDTTNSSMAPAINLPNFIPTPGHESAAAAETPANRLDRWKRKLLDLTLNNRLLNFRDSKKNLPVLCPDLGSLEDALADGQTFKVYPRLGDLGEGNSRNASVHRSRTGKESMDEMLREELIARRLHADVTDTEINRRLLEIYREAKLSIEENGANTLYLALGFLAWYETATSPKRRLAPIILIPLVIERHSVQEGFTIKQGDDEPMVNVTLLAQLATDFDLTISGLDPIPMDDHGIDVPLILRKFREAVVDIDRWEVLESAYIGHFSFTKFLMWRDLEVRAEDLQKNAIVKHLIHTPSQLYPDDGVFPDPERLDETHSPEETFCPLSSDSSQLAAVHAAAAGKSFVLHGPPGTGKSQTITNIIAHNLALGKTVLFVSEKRAALEVVHRRLTESGLGPFCLELHSNKSHKKGVLSQLEQAVNATVTHSRDEWQAEARKLGETRKELNAFVTALHAVRASGESVFHGISQLIGVREIPHVKLHWPSVDHVDRQRLDTLRETVHQLQLAGAQTGHPSTNAWALAGCETWTPELRNGVESALDDLQKILPVLEEAVRGIASIVGFNEESRSSDDLENLAITATALLNCPAIPPVLLSSAEWEEVKRTIRDIAAHGILRNQQRELLYRQFDKRILDLDLDGLRQQWSVAQKAWLLPRWLACRKVRQTLVTVTQPGHPLQGTDIPAVLDQAVALRSEENFIQHAASRVEAILGMYWQNGEADWYAIEGYLERTEALRKVASSVAGMNFEHAIQLRTKWAQLISEGREQLSSDGSIGRRFQAFIETFENFKKVKATLTSMLVLDAKAAWEPATTNNCLARIQEQCSKWQQQLTGLRAWCHWRSARKEALALNLQPLVDAYEKNGLATEKLSETFARGYYQWWCDAIIGAEPALCGFFSSAFEDKIRLFKETDDKYIRLTQKEIQARVASRLPRGQASNPNSEMGLLRHQLQRKVGHLPVRALIQKIPNLLPRLKPCLLMSPISVAQYLDPSQSSFDLVVFDEASQIPVWDAVGAIARGKEAIIVGDPKQLPPTNFFSRADSSDGTDADDGIVEDLESILDDCIAAQLPQRHLNWHYRSRHESLIAFSNYHYYDNRLFTFPSPHKELGVSFRAVQGEYDKGKSRTNRAEAKAVVADVVRRLSDPQQANHSIGIVTFSQAQQQLIDDLLEEARRQTPEIEPHFADGAAEPVFIKNLENVQGDERDIILFSICYGPDATGRVSMNFGPMNRDGGERRLNVAITRARQEVVVFSTLRAEHIDLSKTRAQGVADLKCFLDYAERGQVAITERRSGDGEGECESPFEIQVCDALRQKGYTVHPQVGCSGYRIDLAIVDPEHAGRYILGIECDGANYHRSKTARDRDKLRESILVGLGWTIHRIWSTDWWERPGEELARIEAAIETAREKANAPPSSTKSATAPSNAAVVSMAGTAPDVKLSELEVTQPSQEQELVLPVYEPFIVRENKGTPDDFYHMNADSSIRALIEAVVSKEGPVSLDLVARRVAEHWGVGRVTSRTIKRIQESSGKANVKIIREGGMTFLWGPAQDPKTYSLFRIAGNDDNSKRDAETLPPQEVANAALHVLEQHVSLPATDLVRETARVLGYQRTGPAVEKAVREGISLLMKRAGAKQEDNVIIHIPGTEGRL
jgi:Superfamily I DNA and RNA helicases and helicase subunits